MPAPPSLVAEPPSPITTVRAPASTAAATSRPSPYEVVRLRVALGRGEQVQAARLGALQVGGRAVGR